MRAKLYSWMISPVLSFLRHFWGLKRDIVLNMSRIASLFLLLLLFLVSLLYIYETSSVRGIVKLRHKDKSIANLSVGKFSSSISSETSFEAISSDSKLTNSDNSLNDIEINSTKTEPPVQVIVLARMRTGSTLCGEILNQNPEIFFIFEPLHTLKVLHFSQDKDLTYEDYQEECTDLLKKLYKCKFPRMFIHTISRWGIGKGKSKALLPICRVTAGCKNAVPSQVQKKCIDSGSHVATKTIRADIKMLRPLVKVHGINLKIIHLMRDPRGTASSRRLYYTPRMRGRPDILPEMSLQGLGLLSTSANVKKNTIPQLCTWMKDTLKDALDKPKWLQHRYKLVRYEDLAQDPLRLSRAIYDFIGLDMPDIVLKWIQDNTESDNISSKRQFSTHKNSSLASTSWREKLSLKEVLDVQDICGEVMSSLGYRKVYTQSELDDYSLPVVDHINLPTDIMIV